MGGAPGWTQMRRVAVVSVQEPGDTFASGIHLPNDNNVAALETQVVAALRQSGRGVVDLARTQQVLSGDDFYRAVQARIPDVDVHSQYRMLSGNFLDEAEASPHTVVGLNMFDRKAEDRFRTWFVPSVGPLLQGLGADGFVLVGAAPELNASYLRGAGGPLPDSGRIQRIGIRVSVWIADVQGHVLAMLEQSAATSNTGPEHFQIETAVQEVQKTALDGVMQILAKHPPGPPEVAPTPDDSTRD